MVAAYVVIDEGIPRIADIDEDDNEMASPALVEVFHRCLALRQGRDEVGLGGLLVGMELARTDAPALADPGVDDDAIEPTEIGDGLLEHREHLVVVVDVELVHHHLDVWVRCEQLDLERLKPVDTTSREREVVALCGEDAGHACTEAGACTGDQNVFAHVIDTTGV